MIPTLPENTEKFCEMAPTFWNIHQKIPTKRYPPCTKNAESFLKKKYPYHEKSTEILLKKGTHLAKKIQKISRKQPMYSLA